MLDRTKIEVDVQAKDRIDLSDRVGYVKVDRAKVRVRSGKGEWLKPKDWEIVERGDAVALLLHVEDGGEDKSGSVVLTRQFRAPLLNRRETTDLEADTVMLEAIAGIVQDTDASPRHALARETLEEVGYAVDPDLPESDERAIEEITRFYPSPGISSERITVYYARVRAEARTGAGGGNPDDGELIEPIEMPVEAFFEAVDGGEIADSKLLVGAARLRERVEQFRAKQEGGVLFRYQGAGAPVRLHLRFGDIKGIKDAQVWVNSENTLMEMDQFVGKSVSATVRSGAAYVDEHENLVKKDVIGDSLRSQMHWKKKIGVGEVLETGSGRLRRDNGVLRVFHVASVEGRVGIPVKAEIKDVPVCVANALRRIERRNGRMSRLFGPRYVSAALPIFGTGKGQLDFMDAFAATLEGVRSFAAEHPQARLVDLHISVFARKDFNAAISHLITHASDFVREEA